MIRHHIIFLIKWGSTHLKSFSWGYLQTDNTSINIIYLIDVAPIGRILSTMHTIMTSKKLDLLSIPIHLLLCKSQKKEKKKENHFIDFT